MNVALFNPLRWISLLNPFTKRAGKHVPSPAPPQKEEPSSPQAVESTRPDYYDNSWEGVGDDDGSPPTSEDDPPQTIGDLIKNQMKSQESDDEDEEVPQVVQEIQSSLGAELVVHGVLVLDIGDNKVKVINAVRSLADISLGTAKALVDSEQFLLLVPEHESHVSEVLCSTLKTAGADVSELEFSYDSSNMADILDEGEVGISSDIAWHYIANPWHLTSEDD